MRILLIFGFILASSTSKADTSVLRFLTLMKKTVSEADPSEMLPFTLGHFKAAEEKAEYIAKVGASSFLFRTSNSYRRVEGHLLIRDFGLDLNRVLPFAEVKLISQMGAPQVSIYLNFDYPIDGKVGYVDVYMSIPRSSNRKYQISIDKFAAHQQRAASWQRQVTEDIRHGVLGSDIKIVPYGNVLPEDAERYWSVHKYLTPSEEDVNNMLLYLVSSYGRIFK